MKEKNIRNIIIYILFLLFTILTMVTQTNTRVVSAVKKDSKGIQLNEEYTKEDFDFSKNRFLSSNGVEKLRRNNYKLVLDGKAVNITFSSNPFGGDYARVFENYGIKEIEFRNLYNITYLNYNAFKNNNIEYLDLSPLVNLEIMYGNIFENNNIKYVNLNGLKKLYEIGDYVFIDNQNLKEIHVEELKNLKKIGDLAFMYNNTKVYVAYKNPNNLKNANETVTYGGDSGSWSEKIYGHVIVDEVQNKLDEVKKKFEESKIGEEKRKELNSFLEELSTLFENDTEMNKWLQDKGYNGKDTDIKSKYKNIEEEINAELRRITELEPWAETNEKLLRELAECETKISEYSKQQNELKELYQEELIKRLKEKIKGLEGKITELNNDNNAKDQEIEKLKKEKEVLEKEKEKLLTEKSEFEKEIEKLKTEIEKLQNESKDTSKLEEKIKELEAKIKELEEKLKKCGESKKELEEKISKLTSELDKTNTEKDERIKKLEEEKKELEKRKKELEENNCCVDKKENSNLNPKIDDDTKVDYTNIKNKKSNNNENSFLNKLPYAGSESVIILSLITIGAILYTKHVMKRK